MLTIAPPAVIGRIEVAAARQITTSANEARTQRRAHSEAGCSPVLEVAHPSSLTCGHIPRGRVLRPMLLRPVVEGRRFSEPSAGSGVPFARTVLLRLAR